MRQTFITAQPGTREVVTTHVFNAAPEVVFRTYTDPALIPDWWGAKHLTTIVDEMDVRPGGAWRFVQRDEDGNEFAFRGIYQEVVPHERLVSTVECEETPGRTVLETVTFEEVNGRTKLTTRSSFPPLLNDDRIAVPGQDEGDAETMNRLGDLLIFVA